MINLKLLINSHKDSSVVCVFFLSYFVGFKGSFYPVRQKVV